MLKTFEFWKYLQQEITNLLNKELKRRKNQVLDVYN